MSTPMPSLLEARPQLRPDVILGPAVDQGTSMVHNVKDPRTGWYFRVGVKEFFLLSRLDGRRSLAGIGSEYEQRFQRRLAEEHFQQLLGLLAGRHLLLGTEEPEQMADAAAAARKQSRRGTSLLYYRRPLVNPDRFFTWLAPRIRFCFSPYFVVPALLAIVCMEIGVATHAGELFAEVTAGRRLGYPIGLSAAVIWVILALHESAHGLTCKHFGGETPEIGIIWRFPLIAPYCKADDVVLFQRPRHRVYTAFAGVFVSLLVLLPVGVVTLVAEPGGLVATVAAGILLFGSAAGLVNLIPVVQLDGYFMVNHALNMVDLRRHTYKYWWDLAKRTVGVLDAMPNYSTRARRAYVAYGAASAALLLPMAAYFVVRWFGWLSDALGAPVASVVMSGAIIIGVALGLMTSRRARRKLKDGSSYFESPAKE